MITIEQFLKLNVGDKIIDTIDNDRGTIIVFNKISNRFSIMWSNKTIIVYHITKEAAKIPGANIPFFSLLSTTKQLELEF